MMIFLFGPKRVPLPGVLSHLAPLRHSLSEFGDVVSFQVCPQRDRQHIERKRGVCRYVSRRLQHEYNRHIVRS